MLGYRLGIRRSVETGTRMERRLTFRIRFGCLKPIKMNRHNQIALEVIQIIAFT